MENQVKDELRKFFNFEKVKKSQNNVVLFGSVGNGKTSLLNKLCGQFFKTAQMGFSCTRMVQFATTLTGDALIIDFPGLNAMVEVHKHIMIQKETLKLIPFRMICFVIKFSCRFDDMIKEASQMLKIFYKYIKNVLVIITHSEKADKVIIAEIEHEFKEKYKLERILFTQFDTNSDELQKNIDKFKNSMVNIEEPLIESREFYSTIDPEFDIAVQEIREEYIARFQKRLKAVKNIFNRTDNKEMKRSLYIYMKQVKNELIDEYKEKLKNVLSEISAIVTEVIMFNNQIFQDFDNFRKLAQTHLEIQGINYQGKLNRYKKCPHCGNIWFRVYGCDSMKCGNRSIGKDKLIGVFSLFFFKFFHDEDLIVEEKQENSNYNYQEREIHGLTPEETEENKQRGSPQKSIIKPQGCGQRINWNEMEDVTEIVLRELKELSMSDYDHSIHKVEEEMREKK